MEIFVARGEETAGPFTEAQVREYLTQGVLQPDDLIYHTGLSGWTPLAQALPAKEPQPIPDFVPPVKAAPDSGSSEKIGGQIAAAGTKRISSRIVGSVVIGSLILGLLVFGGATMFLKDDPPPSPNQVRQAEVIPGETPPVIQYPSPPFPTATEEPAATNAVPTTNNVAPVGPLPLLPPSGDPNANATTNSVAPSVATTPSAKMIEASIRRMVRKPEGELTAADFAKVTRLSVGAGTNKVSDLSYLVNCPNLESIYAQSQAITDLAPLAKLPKLKDISISFNPVKDLSPLAEVTELQELWLQGAQVEDVTPLAGLAKLETLYLDRNQALTDLKPLANLPALRKLSLYEMRAVDLAPLASLPKLEELNLAKLPPESLATLKPPLGLKELVFSPGPDTDLAALFNGIYALEKLRVTDARRVSLRKLIDAVKMHETLIDFGLPMGGISDATPLADLPNLERLDLAGNFIENLEPIGQLEKLNTLLLSGNRVKDVAPLAGCKKLGTLWLQGNPVEDPTPLHDMKQLRSVTLRGTPVTDEQREALRQALPNCFVDSKSAQ